MSGAIEGTGKRMNVHTTDEEKWLIREISQNHLKKKYREARSRGADWPENLDEAVSEVLRRLSSAAREELVAIPKEELPGVWHFGVGLWIRNKFALASYLNVPLLLSCARAVGRVEEYRGQEYSLLDADAASAIIIAEAWKKLQSQNSSDSAEEGI
ncbi:MAG: DUF6794 domain-containing protein [Candidatus Latescibacterota bacterium]